METRVSHSDLEQAKRELRARRASLLRRHAEELSALDAEQEELASLEKLMQSFSRKFATATPHHEVPVAATAAIMAPPMPSARSKYIKTNFELFSQANSSSTF